MYYKRKNEEVLSQANNLVKTAKKVKTTKTTKKAIMSAIVTQATSLAIYQRIRLTIYSITSLTLTHAHS